MVLFGQKCLYSSKSGLLRASGSIRVKVVLLGQGDCIRAKVVVFGQSGCIRVKVVVLDKVVVFGQK